VIKEEEEEEEEPKNDLQNTLKRKRNESDTITTNLTIRKWTIQKGEEKMKS
jgi:hypothetical protein